MCGIAGYIYKDNRKEAEQNILKKMTDAVKHRGPDAEGQWIRNNVALGHRRLAIIDLDEKSNQPMHSHDGRFVISFNGEIYNYLELRSKLQQSGAVFRTNCDTEVILEAYRKYGTGCFSKFNGMWALCLYDIEKKCLLFCRDRFGIKPLYTLDREDVYAFGSEIKAILAAFPEENVPDITSVYRYLSGSLGENADEKSFYKNIKIFPPAMYMIYDLRTGRKKFESYWKVDEERFRRKWITGRYPVVTFRKLFEDAVALRLRADVEVGACLSGGVDSSAIVGCAAKKHKKKMHTFSSIYKDRDCNEEPYIRMVNKKCGAVPHFVEPDKYEDKFVECIKKITYFHDGPAQSASLYSQYMVMKRIHNHVKVVLDGQGADEIFAGYIPYYSYYIDDLASRGGICHFLKAVKTLTILKKEWPDAVGAVSTDLIARLVGIHNSFFFQNDRRMKEEQMDESMQLFTEDFIRRVNDNCRHSGIKCSSKLNTRLCEDLQKRSIPMLLHNEDSNSMAFSIESRVPFLDYRIVEFAIALDGKYKIKNGWTKWIIRKSCRKYLPEKVAKRKNKMGFPAPFARWLQSGKSREEIRNIIYDFAKRNIVPRETIDTFYNLHMSGKSDKSSVLFKYFNMEIWLRTCENSGTELQAFE